MFSCILMVRASRDYFVEYGRLHIFTAYDKDPSFLALFL